MGPVVLSAEESKGEPFPTEPRTGQLMGSEPHLYVKGKMGLPGEETKREWIHFLDCTITGQSQRKI